MKLFRTKIWSWSDLWILKWCAFLFGLIGGAYLSDFVQRYVVVILVLAVILAVKSGIKYFGASD